MAASAADPSPLRVRAVVFDWDGTLVETMPIKVANAAELFSRHFGADRENVVQSYRKYSGVSRRELFEMIAMENIGRGLTSLEFNRLSGEFTSMNLMTYDGKDIFGEGTFSVLQSLRDLNLLLFISSSAVKDEIDELARALGIFSYFKETLGARGSFRKGKPHLDYIRRKYGLKTTEIVFVGDEEADMRLGSQVGVRCIGIDPGRRNLHKTTFADHVIGDLSELTDVLSHV